MQRPCPLSSSQPPPRPSSPPLSLHDALPISRPGPPDRARRDAARALRRDLLHGRHPRRGWLRGELPGRRQQGLLGLRDRKSTRLNSSHANISYAVFCLKKNSITTTTTSTRPA